MDERPLTDAAGLGPAPRPVRLAEPPRGSHQHQRGQAGEGDGRAVGEASVLPPALRGDARVSAEHSCNGHRDTSIAISLPKSSVNRPTFSLLTPQTLPCPAIEL